MYSGGVPDFYKFVPVRYVETFKFACKIISMFSSTYQSAIIQINLTSKFSIKSDCNNISLEIEKLVGEKRSLVICNDINLYHYYYNTLTFHISYTIPIANYSAEREFSKLVRIKNKYRTNSFQENLNSFMVLCTESDVLESSVRKKPFVHLKMSLLSGLPHRVQDVLYEKMCYQSCITKQTFFAYAISSDKNINQTTKQKTFLFVVIITLVTPGATKQSIADNFKVDHSILKGELTPANCGDWVTSFSCLHIIFTRWFGSLVEYVSDSESAYYDR
ncbi:zinc finger MYM-type protein 1-like [Aphis craccivora]|uniref:Zinc finger MYM-type protein 1-like n=1 Tax=Aphis craccivora TaxID=307492 RepID=A0A6G0YVR4_APHCR|nr:zinc finger MYM-type protein 1-like [Aphis craccivora]